MNFQTVNRVMGEMKLVVVAITPDADHPVKIKRDSLAPGQRVVHRVRYKPDNPRARQPTARD